MKRRVFLAIATFAALLAAFVVASVSAAPAPASAVSFPLYAGQTTQVGVVYVWDTPTTLFIEIDLDDGWCMTESHVAAAANESGIPQTSKGNPIPGQFPLNENYSPCEEAGDTFTFPLSTFGGDKTPVIAVHAKVWEEDSLVTTTVVSRPGVPVNPELLPDPPVGAVAAIEPGVGVTYPNCPAGDNDAIASIWDSNARFLNGAAPDWGTADWIWNAPYPANPVTGEVVNFTDAFTIPAGWQLGGNLIITADNAFRATLTGVTLGDSISLGPNFPTTLEENAKVGDWGVASQGWQLVNQYSLAGLTAGAKTLAITAANEYMYPDDSYQTWNAGPPQGYNAATAIDPNGADRCINPAGLIYKLTAGTYTHEETAWADGGGDFEGANWATFINYTLQEELLLETVTVPADTPLGATSTTVLANGQTYEFRVTGTVTWLNNVGLQPTPDSVDAECYAFNGAAPWLPAPFGLDFLTELQVNGADVNWEPVGTVVNTCSADHEYNLPFTGTGATVNFRMYDGLDGVTPIPVWYDDNDGSLTVQIWWTW
jgi:hypothetical protein